MRHIPSRRLCGLSLIMGVAVFGGACAENTVLTPTMTFVTTDTFLARSIGKERG